MKLRDRIYLALFADKYQQYISTHVALKETEARLDRAERKLALLQPARARFDRYRPMDEDQLAEVLAGAGDLPAVKAIMQMIDEKFQQASDAAADPSLADGQTKFHLGGADWIVRLKAELQSALEQSREVEARK